jgi:hypothetical protein
LCDYKTDRKYNYTTHLKSLNHKCKEEDDNNKIIKDKQMIEKIIERRIKVKYEDMIDDLEKKLKKYRKYKKMYHNIVEKVVDKSIDYFDKTNELLVRDKEDMKKILEKSLENNNIVAKTTKKSVSAINYLIKHCANSHSIESYNIDSIKNNDLLKIAFNPKHMGVVLTNLCITIDGIDKSGIRCMDYNRLKFGVNIGGNWVTDTTGNIIKDKIIKPVKDKAYKCLNQWMTELTTKGNVPTEDIKKYQKGIENIRALDDDKMQNIILKKLGSNCMIDRDKLCLFNYG